MDREAMLGALRASGEPWDFIVVGGGATGLGVAIDAASRGYEVVLLEQSDFAKGTSSRSTKLVHGGVRYLQQGNVSLVLEALRERGVLLKNAPHVVHKQAFVIPCYSLWQRVFYGAGLKVYDILAGKYGIGRSRFLSRREVVDRLPDIASSGLTGGVLYFDGQFDDARLLIDMAVTASSHGAAILNYAAVTGLEFDGNEMISGVEFRDVENGGSFSAKARVVINAAGAFCDAVRNLSDPKAGDIITYSQGVHLVFENKYLAGDSALMIPKTNDGRVLFCIPWHGRLLVGTTDTPVETPLLEPTALEEEINFVLDTAGNYLRPKPTRADILSVFAGIRPLVNDSAAATKTSMISRGHDLFVDRSGLITITGGKWTTYRRMAEDAIDRAIAVAGLPRRPCLTADLEITNEAFSASESLHPRLPCTREEVTRAVHFEMARTVEDVLARRTRVLFLDARAAIEIAPEVAEIMANELGRDQEWVSEQVRDLKKLAE